LPPYVFVMIGLYAGLRREEILALRWDCVFLDGATPYISVRRAWRSVNNSVLSFFYDVPNDAYYYEAVKWAQEKGVTGGIGNNLFGPNQPCTRAQIVTFLWRAAGSPEPKTMSSFTDVPADSYYAKAVAWAIGNGITNGAGGDRFSPDADCTRAQIVTFLYRYMQSQGKGFTAIGCSSSRLPMCRSGAMRWWPGAIWRR
ncbi:MAG: S-layer homology domain-containing protein, partial [Clostridia bacterium]|nr:S-layer homology domain-containing protein [Clostridia bacterium]